MPPRKRKTGKEIKVKIPKKQVLEDDDSHDNNKVCDDFNNKKNEPIEMRRRPSLAERSFPKLQELWAKIEKETGEEMLADYKKQLKRILTGRESSLLPIRHFLPAFPEQLLDTHEQLFELICEVSNTYAFQNHDGLTLISRHRLADEFQIGAQLVLECLSRGLQFDVQKELSVCRQIARIVRIGVKDMLEEAAQKTPEGSISADQFAQSLTARLLPS